MRKSALAILTLGVVLITVGCAGSTTGTNTEQKATANAEPPPEVVLGELAFGWRTDFSKHTVPLSEFQSGGPGKDGIPAIHRPRFAPVAEIRFLEPQEPVIQLVLGSEARAYPLQIMIWHEIVNDSVQGVPVAVTFCPLCNTAIVFDRRLDGRTLGFGTTGNLRNSDLVMYDRQTESWWQQFGGAGVVGFYAGKKLKQIAARIVAWKAFRQAHSDGLVLTRDTGHVRQYGQNPYTGYDDVDSSVFFPAKNLGDRRLPPKERVVFFEVGKRAAAVPLSTLEKRRVVRVTVGGRKLTVQLTGEAASALDTSSIPQGRLVGTAEVRDARGRAVPFDVPFWFAVAAFRPDTTIVRG